MPSFYTVTKKSEFSTSPMDDDNSTKACQVSMSLKEKEIDGGWNWEAGHEASQSSTLDLVRNVCPTVT